MKEYLLIIISLFLIVFMIYFYLYTKENYYEVNTDKYYTNDDNLRDRNFTNYKFACLKPRNYHRYGSNLSDPTQDKLPITFPNPNEGLPPVKITSPEQEIIYNLKNGII